MESDIDETTAGMDYTMSEFVDEASARINFVVVVVADELVLLARSKSLSQGTNNDHSEGLMALLQSGLETSEQLPIFLPDESGNGQTTQSVHTYPTSCINDSSDQNVPENPP